MRIKWDVRLQIKKFLYIAKYYVGEFQSKEICWTSSTYEGGLREIYTEFSSASRKGKYHFEYLDLNWKVILKLMSQKCSVKI